MPVALRYVPIEDMEYWWPVLEPLLKRACERDGSDLSIEELHDRVFANDVRLWFAEIDGRIVACMATGEITMGADRAIHIFAVGGDGMDDWLGPALSEFERLARKNGIARVRLNGRPGWSRAMPDYRVTSVIMEKRLDGRHNDN